MRFLLKTLAVIVFLTVAILGALFILNRHVGYSYEASMGPRTGSCEVLDSKTVRLAGKIDDAMRTCALETITDNIEIVRVRSRGGEVFAGRAIGFQIGKKPRTLIIEGACLSSCGNYFIPAADRLELMPGGFIGLHGTPDPSLLDSINFEKMIATSIKEGRLTEEEGRISTERQAEKDQFTLSEENEFAGEFNVQLGWRLYRDIGDDRNGWLQYFQSPDASRFEKWAFILVEQDMLSTCLPDLALDSSFQNSLQKELYSKTWMRLLLWNGHFVRSGDLKCDSRIYP